MIGSSIVAKMSEGFVGGFELDLLLMSVAIRLLFTGPGRFPEYNVLKREILVDEIKQQEGGGQSYSFTGIPFPLLLLATWTPERDARAGMSIHYYGRITYPTRPASSSKNPMSEIPFAVFPMLLWSRTSSI
jgi:hypothetical protein